MRSGAAIAAMFFCLGCDRGGLALRVALIESPDVLEMVGVPYGERSFAVLTLHNVGTAPAQLIVQTEAPFAVDVTAFRVAAGASVGPLVFWTPESFDDAFGRVEVVSRVATTGVDIVGSVSVDADFDGFEHLAAGGLDCDDADPSIHPGADDPCDDGVDQNCDGSDTCGG